MIRNIEIFCFDILNLFINREGEEDIDLAFVFDQGDFDFDRDSFLFLEIINIDKESEISGFNK